MGVCFVIFCSFVLLVALGSLIGGCKEDLDQRRLLEGREESFEKFCRQVPSLENGDFVIMDSGNYVVRRGSRGKSPNIGVTLEKIGHNQQRNLHILYDNRHNIKNKNQIVADFLATKKIVRKNDREWPELYQQFFGGIAN